MAGGIGGIELILIYQKYVYGIARAFGTDTGFTFVPPKRIK